MKACRFAWLSIVLLACVLSTPIGGLAQQQTLEVYLSDPSEGETYYAGPSSLCYTIKIQGYIISPDDPFKNIQVTLELIKDGRVVDIRTTTPNMYGEFYFPATVNPGAADGMFTPVEIEAHCEDCHYRTGLNLPTGNFIVRVTATTPQGETASAERQVRTDLSKYVTIPVQVVLEENPQEAVAGISVMGSTWLYLWRARVKSGLTGEDGVAALKVEALSQAPTNYKIAVEPTILNGYLYQGTATVDVTLNPGAVTGEQTTLKITRKLGQIEGRFTAQDNPISISTPIWLVHLPDASTQKIDVERGAFTLPEVLIGQYLIAADARLLAKSGFKLESQSIDLVQSLEATVDLPLMQIKQGSVHARVMDEGGRLLPFAWITLENEKSAHQLAPGSELLEIFDLPEEDQTAIISAPGYYSLATVLSSHTENSTEINLTIRPETRIFPWGSGSITLPPESAFTEQGLDIQFERGWLWGEGGEEQPLKIYLPGAVITIQQGKFALENMPGKTPWFYLWEGNAQIESSVSGESIPVTQNQMVAITGMGKMKPVTLDPVVTAAFQASDELPFDPTWQPGFKAQVRDRLALIGIGTAQLVTFITYSLVFLSIILFPVYWIYSSYRKRSLPKEKIIGTEDIQ